MNERVHPTQDDPVVAALSEGVGGPVGDHVESSGRQQWWTPLRVVLAFTAVCFALGMIQKAPCYQDSWQDGKQRYSSMCYSDLPYLYTGRGFAELHWPYSDDPQVRARYETMEYPVGISYFAWGSAWLTHWASGAPDVGDRASRPAGELFSDQKVSGEVRLYVVVTAVLLGLGTLLAAYFLAGVNPRRPWDAMAFAVSPALALTGLVNWDLLAVTLVAAALWAWARDRPVLTGVLIGLGCATKLYPLFLLGGLLVICVRDRRLPDFAKATAAAAGAWVLANAPAYLTGSEQWKVFWSFNSERGADLGSIWMLVAGATDQTIKPETINTTSWVFFGAWCLAVLVVGLRAPVTPRFAQLGFLIVAGFLLVNKVYSPQYVLWLLPLAVLARPRWRDLIIWQAGEIFYFAAVWWYLGGYIAPASGDDPAAYWLAILLRMACELYLIAVVVRDVLWPYHDPVDREPDAQRVPATAGAGIPLS